MGRSVVVLVSVAAVFLGSCGTQAIGEMERESQSIDLENAQSVRAELRMGAGELNVTGGADALMEADFAYNVADWEPEVDYDVSGDTGELKVEQGSGEDIPLGGEPRNEWDLRFNDAVPIDLNVQMGAGETTVDLTGSYDRDIAATIEGGVGEATVQLPSEIGVRVNAEGGLGQINAEGLQREGDAYVNDAYGDSDVTLDVDVRGGVGQINLEVV
jgi:hypothetical protein